mmetsp:Transcript_22080/g.48450  ORF Transcript_22080/g.48450 Transcript_22080/m.48450 type:complete len:470 (-) Transcript_22080:75-1484(-)
MFSNSSWVWPSTALGQGGDLANMMVRGLSMEGAWRYPGTRHLAEGTGGKVRSEMHEGDSSIIDCTVLTSFITCEPSDITCVRAGRRPWTCVHTGSVTTICPGCTLSTMVMASIMPCPLYTVRLRIELQRSIFAVLARRPRSGFSPCCAMLREGVGVSAASMSRLKVPCSYKPDSHCDDPLLKLPSGIWYMLLFPVRKPVMLTVRTMPSQVSDISEKEVWRELGDTQNWRPSSISRRTSSTAITCGMISLLECTNIWTRGPRVMILPCLLRRMFSPSVERSGHGAAISATWTMRQNRTASDASSKTYEVCCLDVRRGILYPRNSCANPATRISTCITWPVLLGSTLITTTTSESESLFLPGGFTTCRPSPFSKRLHPRSSPKVRCGNLAIVGGSTSYTDSSIALGLVSKLYSPRCLRTTPDLVRTTSLPCIASPDITICPPLAASPSSAATFTPWPENWTCLVSLLSSLM